MPDFLGLGKITTLGKNKKINSRQSARIDYRKDPHLIQIPGNFFPHSQWVNSALWIKMTARKLESINTAGRGGSLRIGEKGTTFKFLAPSQIVDNQQHTWEEYSSIQSRLLQFVISASTAIDQGSQVYQNLKTRVIDQIKKGEWPSGQQIVDALIGGTATNIPKLKMDTPLRYVNSTRRTFQLTFILADANGGKDVLNAVEQLQKYAAPDSSENSVIDIEYPYIFRVETEPYGIFTMNYSALENVLVTWQEPYIQGRASRAELTLGFKDMSPLFRKTIERGGIINVNTPPEIEREQSYENQRFREATRRWQEFQRNRESSFKNQEY
jgi:hypothetical protein